MPSRPPALQELPEITFRQLEVFCMVCHEGSYANAAVELRTSRANVKRVCDEFQAAVERPLFSDGPDRTLVPTSYALGLIGQVGTLSRSLRRLGETVKKLHEAGRILRFAAAGEFFKGGLFTDFLARLQISDSFRPCFLRIEMKRLRTALLNAECDVYFGAGITASDRLDQVDLGPVPWRLERGTRFAGPVPASPGELAAGKWWIATTGDADSAGALVELFHQAGACGGRVFSDGAGGQPADDEISFHPDITAGSSAHGVNGWPCYRFSAVLRKNHPYSELMPRLSGAALS